MLPSRRTDGPAWLLIFPARNTGRRAPFFLVSYLLRLFSYRTTDAFKLTRSGSSPPADILLPPDASNLLGQESIGQTRMKGTIRCLPGRATPRKAELKVTKKAGSKFPKCIREYVAVRSLDGTGGARGHT